MSKGKIRAVEADFIKKHTIDRIIALCRSGVDEGGNKLESVNVALKMKPSIKKYLKIAQNKTLEIEGVKINGKKDLLLFEFELVASKK